MFKSLRNLVLPRTAPQVELPLGGEDGGIDYVRLVDRIIAGDSGAEAELVDRFKNGPFYIILRIVKDYSTAEDLSQDTFVTIIRKVRNGDVQQPEKLASFVAQVARFQTIEYLRKIRRRGLGADLGEAEQFPDPAPNGLQQLQTAEQLDEVRDLIGRLIPRDRELLLRFYINEEPKLQICADLGLTSTQFDRVLYRARQRYKELYLGRNERTRKGGNR